MSDQGLARSRLHFGPRNWLFLAAAVAALATGYWLLHQGSTTAAPILLVIGYCVFFPVGLGLYDLPYDGRIAQRFRAPALHAGSRGFESLFAHWGIRPQREDCARETAAMGRRVGLRRHRRSGPGFLPGTATHPEAARPAAHAEIGGRFRVQHRGDGRGA